MNRAIFAVFTLLALAGCRRVHVSTPSFGISQDQSYIDVTPGSRLRVITPLLSSGGFRVRSNAPAPTASAPGTTLEIRTDHDFLGYETSWYVFEPKSGATLSSVESIIDGRKETRTAPAVKLFEGTAKCRYLRLIFLTRVSSADHDMAVLTAKRFEDLAPRTAGIKQRPDSACTPAIGCSWIPAGIAVTVEPPRKP